VLGVGHNRLSVRVRITLLLGLTALTFAAVLAFVQRGQESQLGLLMRDRTAQTARMFEDFLDLKASGARVHADDYTRWDDFVAFTKRPNPTWGRINLTESIATFGLDAAWVLDERFQPIFTANPSGTARFDSLPVPLGALHAALRTRPIRHFFTPSPEAPLEIWTSPIQPSDDFSRKAPISGYYIVARRWTPSRIAELGRLAHGSTAVVPRPGPRIELGGWADTGLIRTASPLLNLRGDPVALVVLETTFPMAPRVHAAARLALILMLCGALILFALMAWGLTHWVVRPLSAITASLRREDPGLLQETTSLGDEFGDLGRLVRDFFEQKQHLVEAREEALTAVQAKSRFLAGISHELRTPMHGVLSFARFGCQDARTAEREELIEYFQQIEESGRTLLALLDDLLDLSKFEAGRMKLEFEEAPVEDIVAAAAQEFESLYREKRLTLTIRIEEGLRPAVVDRMKLRQVLRNLLSNAAKFTPEGGSVAVSLEPRAEVARIGVQDTGRGIPEGELESIFETFTQASNHESHVGGTGLGLALCREIILAHGGRIWAENVKPAGARITAEIPFEGPLPVDRAAA